jgi:exodeoxyribonuclease V alpha subunit
LAGAVSEASVGAFLTLEGRFEEHGVHGHQFRASGYLLAMPRTLEGLTLYLGSSGVPGVGPKLAARIVDAFGLSTARILSEAPERLLEVRGIKEAKAQAISELWTADAAGRAQSILLRSLGLSARVVERIRQRYGERTIHVVAQEPYRLAEEVRGIGFHTADALARQQGLAEDDPARVRSAVVHVLDRETREGNCFLPRAEVGAAVAALGVPIHGVDAAIDAADRAGRVVVDDERVWPVALYSAEVAVALQVVGRRQRLPPADDGEVERAERFERVTLAPEQRSAVGLALGGGITVVTGGPGTGKTTLVKVLLRAAIERGLRVLLASPTGRAAKRLEEATGRPASTIHRLLQFKPGGGGFERGLQHPLEGELLVVDEASMLDLPLFAALIDALPPPPFSLVLVGDADQLPSVGPGQVLRDLLASGLVPTARLSQIFRQGADSGIIAAAWQIHRGCLPSVRSAAEDFFLVSREDADRARDTVTEIVAVRLAARGFDPRQDVQVLTPTRKGPVGAESLNRALQQRLNPDGAPVRQNDREFRIGDRVLCTKNRYDVEVWNGDVGRVLGADKEGLIVGFDERRVPWGWEDFQWLDLAYAVTVHKAQGSEYPAVVLALHASHGMMLRRNLFYTAVTRAQRFLCVVGSPKAWQRAVDSTADDRRHTTLASRITSGT